MAKPRRIETDIYMIGGPGFSHPDDCAVYLIDAGELVMIDCGVGLDTERLIENIEQIKLSPANLKAVIATHAHIDHIGGLKALKDQYGVRVIAHQFDADRIETGVGVGAEMYGVKYAPCEVDERIRETVTIYQFGDKQLQVLHIPGHTPGSIAVYIDIAGKRILFGQDVHGPYVPEWGGNVIDARESLQKLIDLKADILCEGHFGIYQPAETVRKYISGYLNSLSIAT